MEWIDAWCLIKHRTNIDLMHVIHSQYVQMCLQFGIHFHHSCTNWKPNTVSNRFRLLIDTVYDPLTAFQSVLIPLSFEYRLFKLYVNRKAYSATWARKSVPTNSMFFGSKLQYTTHLYLLVNSVVYSGCTAKSIFFPSISSWQMLWSKEIQ